MKVKSDGPFLREVVLLRERVEEWSRYPYSIPAIAKLESLPPFQAGAVIAASDPPGCKRVTSTSTIWTRPS